MSMSMDMSQKPISSLAKECMEKDDHMYGEENAGQGWWFFLFWFLVIGVIVWFLLFALKPDFVLNEDDHCRKNGEVDQGRVLGCAIVISLIIIFLVWIFSFGYGYNN